MLSSQIGSRTGCRSHRYPWIRTRRSQVPVPADRCGSATRTVRVRLCVGFLSYASLYSISSKLRHSSQLYLIQGLIKYLFHIQLRLYKFKQLSLSLYMKCGMIQIIYLFQTVSCGKNTATQPSDLTLTCITIPRHVIAQNVYKGPLYIVIHHSFLLPNTLLNNRVTAQ